MSCLYRVYDVNLKNFLLEQGLRYELKALDISTHKKMWIFVKTNDLENFIKLWEGKSPKTGDYGRYANEEKNCKKYR